MGSFPPVQGHRLRVDGASGALLRASLRNGETGSREVAGVAEVAVGVEDLDPISEAGAENDARDRDHVHKSMIHHVRDGDDVHVCVHDYGRVHICKNKLHRFYVRS